MPRNKEDAIVTPSSGNVFTDLGFADAGERKTKVRLAFAINQILERRRLSQAEAARRLGINQPKVSALVNYRLDGFSVERLMHFLRRSAGMWRLSFAANRVPGELPGPLSPQLEGFSMPLDSKPILCKTPEELAAAVGLSAAEASEWRLQHALLKRLKEIVLRQGITHAEVAKRAGTSRTRVTAILNGDLDHVSSDLLVRVLAGLGYRVRVSVVKSHTAA